MFEDVGHTKIYRLGCIVGLILALALSSFVPTAAYAQGTPTASTTNTPSVEPTAVPAKETSTPSATAAPVEAQATEPPTATEEATSTPTSFSTPEATPTSPATITVKGPQPVLTTTSTVEPTLVPTLTPEPPVQATPALEPTATPLPSATATPLPPPTPTPSPTPAPPGTSHVAMLVSDSVISVGGTASSEVFVSLQDVASGVQGVELVLLFDPRIAHVAEVMVAPFFPGTQAVVQNQADNQAGRIVLALVQQSGDPIQQTDAWSKVATIVWRGQAEGNSVVGIDGASRFITAGKQYLPPDAAHNGTLFVRAPGRIEGIVKLQGRQDSGDVLVSSSLATTRVDHARADRNGYFVITASYGEGFYSLTAASPGYLQAASDRPIKLTVGSTIKLGEVTLYGGDVNGDNRVDIRDLSFIAWHFSQYDAQADINRDGVVDILDLSLTAGNFGRVGPTAWHVPG